MEKTKQKRELEKIKKIVSIVQFLVAIALTCILRRIKFLMKRQYTRLGS